MGGGDRMLERFGVRNEDGSLEMPKDIDICPHCRKICKHELGICVKTYENETDDFTGKGCGKDRYDIIPMPTESNVKMANEMLLDALMDDDEDYDEDEFEEY